MSKKTLGQAAGKFYMSGTDEDLFLENQIDRKREQEAQEQAAKLLLEASRAKQEEINQKLQTLELLPNGNKVIILPYPSNPYKQVMKGSLIVDYDGSFLNPDSGEQDKMKTLVGCAKVIEVGPDCTKVRPGDDIYYDTRTNYPVPFMSMGYEILPEPNILCIINEGLKARFNMT